MFEGKKTAASPGKAGGSRIDFLDLWRSVCVWMMLLYHAAYDLMLYGILPAAVETHPFAHVYTALCSGGFILLSGICIRMSRNPYRRGAIVFLSAMLVSVVSALAGLPIYFGVLHLLGVCMFLYALLRRWIERLPANRWFINVCLFLFAAAYALVPETRVGARWLFPLGLRYDGFYSADYYPLLPWALLFLTGTLMGRIPDIRRDADMLRRNYPAALTFCGRHSLAIYLIHQPVMYGLCWLLFH